MDLQRLHTFRTVATLMNFNQAAEVLNYSQSAVSAQIKTLAVPENRQIDSTYRGRGKDAQLC